MLSCDSIKNWLAPDEYFSKQTAAAYQEQGFFGKATISKIWQQAMAVKATDFEKLKELSFRHLLSAHGEPLLDTAYHRTYAILLNKNTVFSRFLSEPIT